MIKARIAPAARADLREIRQYSKHAFGASSTRAYLIGLQQTVDLLAERPLIGVPRPQIADGMRQFPYKSHRIFYREEAVGLLIVRILHHSRDLTDQFAEQQ